MKQFVKVLVFGCLVSAITIVGCKKDEPGTVEEPSLPPLASTKPTQPSQNRSTQKAPPIPPGHGDSLPAGHPPIGGAMPKAEAGNVEIDKAAEGSAGLKLTAPEGWQPMEPAVPSNSAFQVAGPLAVFKLEKANDDDTDAVVRLTHFPGMKDIPIQAQLDRWFGMVSQPDGSSTKEAAKVESWEANGVKVTVADMTGTMTSESGSVRMISAAIEHPNGPHFVKAVGSADTIERWHDSIMEYLKTATLE